MSGIRALSSSHNLLLRVGLVGALALGAMVGLDRNRVQPGVVAEEKATGTQWNELVSRLGIQPLYPPSEDFVVGDIWAVLSTKAAAAGTLTAANLIGRSVRIGHIDMRAAINADAARRPLFATIIGNARIEEPVADRLEIAPSAGVLPIALSIVGFPSLARDRNQQAGATLGLSAAGINAARRSAADEDVAMPRAFGYGTDAETARLQLLRWCAEVEPGRRCSQPYLIETLRSVLGGRAVGPDSQVELNFVYYVFLTREIAVSRLNESMSEIGANLAATPGNPQGTASLSNASRDAINANQIYARPLAFGFRAIAVVPPACAEPPEVPPQPGCGAPRPPTSETRP